MTSVSSTTSSTSSTAASSTTSSNSSSTDYSEFDTEALVEAKLSSRYTRLDRLETEVSDNETKIAAYQDLQDKLQSLSDALEALRGDPSSSGKSADVFRDRQAYLTSSTSTAADTYMSATVEEGTALGSHSIAIVQVAKANIVASLSQSSKSDDLGWSGSFTLGTEGGNSATITVTATMSLADITDTINAQQSTSGVKASVMKVAEGSYQLVLTTTETGKTITAADVSGSLLGDSSKLGILDGTAIASDQVLQEAQQAKLKVDGVTITRSSNDIDDVLDGVTLHLYAAPTTDTTLTLEVDNDLSGISDAITSFVDAYNTLRDFVITNQGTNSDGTASDSATLFGDGTLRDIAQTLQRVLSSSVDDSTLAAIGITFDSDNKLELDDTALQSALLDDLDTIQSLFSTTMTSSSGDLALVRHPDAGLSFTLDVTVDANGNLTGVSVGGDSSLFTINGRTITGASGTAYEGLTLVYTGSTTKSITVDLSQGLADRMYSPVNDAAKEEDGGTLKTLIDSLTDDNTTLNDRIDALNSSTAQYANYLYTLYAKYASKISTAQNTLDLLKALLNANSN